ncbi:MAG: GAF domain-containing protein [Chloroflexi bacterium]|nr:GAF domain-containing protein [Chloroflexota bacterium]
MTALELISLVSQVLFVGLFVVVCWAAYRRPSRSHLNTVLLFGSIAAVVTLARLSGWLGLDGRVVTGVSLTLLSVAPLAMLRLVDDFSGTPRWVQWAGVVAFLAVSGLTFTTLGTELVLVELALLAWFLPVGGFAALAFGRAASRARGITRMRMAAVTLGALSFIGAVVVLLLGALFNIEMLETAGQVGALVAVLSFFLGFAPPAWVRQAWREPDLRRFLQSSIHLTGMADERTAVVQLQGAVADAFGATGAAIGLADSTRGVLRYPDSGTGWEEYPEDAYIGGRAFSQQRRVVAPDAAGEDPANAEVYRQNAVRTVIAAPITADDRRLGVLTVYANREPIFVEDDLWLLELLANQTAVLLDARALSADASALKFREDAAQLKEEFLSAAAHDLRTPLTVVLGQAELLERRLARDPAAPIDLVSVKRIAREARRLRDLVSEVLDAQRLEQGAAVVNRLATDLRGVLGAVQQRLLEQGLDLKVVQPDAAVISSVDRKRVEQVLDNLVENALKYTSGGDMPELHLRSVGDEAQLSVVDHGVGIPGAEREQIFERFYRASNVKSITDTGMGLGLFICRRIVEAHGGRIWAELTPGGGSTFKVAIPAEATVSPPAGPAAAAWPISGTEAAADV